MKVLFIGLGGIGQRHLRVLKRVAPEAKISAVRSRGTLYEITDDLEVNTNVNIESKYNIKVFNTINEAIDNSVDCAVIANPTSFHIETALELVRNNIPVLLEKPISNTDSGVDDLIELSSKNNTFVMIGYMMRFHPCVVKLEQYIKERKLGRIYNIAVDVNSFMPSWHKYERYNEFYAGRKDLGGGVILTEIHEIDILNHLFGMPNRLYSIGGKRSALNLNVEDTVSTLMEYKNNNSNFTVTLNMCFVQRSHVRRFQVFGENGDILWDISNNTIVLNDYVNNVHDECIYDKFERNDMFEDQMLHFIHSVKSKTNPITNLKDVVGGHRMAMNIKNTIKKDF